MYVSKKDLELIFNGKLGGNPQHLAEMQKKLHTSDSHSLAANGISQIQYRPTNNFMSDVRSMLSLPADCPFNDVLKKVDEVVEKAAAYHEYLSLTLERATLTVEKYITEGMVKESDKGIYIKLATDDFETTKKVIEGNFEKDIHLERLIKKTGYELYMSGELEKLKGLSGYWFEKKYNEVFH